MSVPRYTVYLEFAFDNVELKNSVKNERLEKFKVLFPIVEFRVGWGGPLDFIVHTFFLELGVWP